MIIKDGDFYSALTHLKEAQALFFAEGPDSDELLEQIEAAEISLKSAITDELDENGEIDMHNYVCGKCANMTSKDNLADGCCPICGTRILVTQFHLFS